MLQLFELHIQMPFNLKFIHEYYHMHTTAGWMLSILSFNHPIAYMVTNCFSHWLMTSVPAAVI